MRIHRRKRMNMIVPVTSMGDIAFLLIIFFILTSNFMKESHLEVTPPVSKDLLELEQAPVSLAIDKHGAVYLQGTEVPAGALDSQLELLLSRRTDKVVMVRIDETVTEEHFRPVLLALSKAGAEPALLGNARK
jgi:biopolymer transport protein ExbD